MNWQRMVIAAFAALFLSVLPAQADVCGAKARAFVAGKPNIKLLAVNTVTGPNGGLICVVTAHVKPKNGGPARVITRQFRP